MPQDCLRDDGGGDQLEAMDKPVAAGPVSAPSP